MGKWTVFFFFDGLHVRKVQRFTVGAMAKRGGGGRPLLKVPDELCESELIGRMVSLQPVAGHPTGRLLMEFK